VGDFTAAAHNDLPPWQSTVVDVLFEVVVNPGEASSVEACVGGGDRLRGR
jgi:hypothetical protein